MDVPEIIRAHGRALARVASAYEVDPSLQEDLLQDILMAIHGALPGLKEPDRIAPFIFRVAHNRGVNHVIKRVSDKKKAPAAGGEALAPTPEQALLASERSASLMAAIRRLPLPYRQVMMLVLEELSYPQIAEALGITASNVGVRVNRAKAQLKAMLDHG
ncbi:MAG TPA: sigma-70 family RNA polymerase sigma factor [Allosphingosinicella sp.]|nr:sigma-70 family RNA polymerase sigma factor [Allosphingosinicella sp.]